MGEQHDKHEVDLPTTARSSILGTSRCVSFPVRQWSQACNHLTKGMRELRSLWNSSASDEEEDGNEFIFEQIHDLAHRLVRCTSGLTQSVREMQANTPRMVCQCEDEACFAPMLLEILETTVIQCHGVLKLKRGRPSKS